MVAVNVLRLVLNSSKDEDLRMKTGNLFHSAGPANAKARFPNFLIDRVTTKSAWGLFQNFTLNSV